MNLVAIIKDFKQANGLKDLVDAFILPIKDYSINMNYTFSLDDVLEVKKLGKEIFVSMNKNIHDSEVDNLKEMLINVEKIGVDGILFYDIAFIQMKKELGLKTDLVWSQEHLVTNYETINYWNDKGANYAYLSSELSKEEIDVIASNSKSKLFMNVFGYVPMFTSRRHLVNNYLEYFGLNDSSKNKTIYKEGKRYPIMDGTYGTTVYSDYILNVLDEDLSSIDYLVFNSHLIDENDFKGVLYNYRNGMLDYKFPYEHGFLYKKVVYRVKKND